MLDARHVTWEPIDGRSTRARLRAGGREGVVAAAALASSRVAHGVLSSRHLPPRRAA
ncbi:MAG TPA: hypothetical protein VIW03_05905 [Anaeromyxobacter sp.]